MMVLKVDDISFRWDFTSREAASPVGRSSSRLSDGERRRRVEAMQAELRAGGYSALAAAMPKMIGQWERATGLDWFDEAGVPERFR